MNITKIIQKIVQHELGKIRIGEIGVVTSVFPHEDEGDENNYECNVKLKNDARDGQPLELRKVPIAIGVIGSAVIPNVGDLVLVSFIHGDVNQPIVTGRLYNDVDRPPVHNPNEIIHRLPLAAEDNETIKIDLRNIPDSDPPRELVIEMPEKIKVQINDNQVVTQVDKTVISVVQAGDDDGTVILESGASKVTINQDGDITVESEGNLSMVSKGDMSLEAPNISIKSEQELVMEAGTDGTFKAGAGANIESSAPLEIKSGATAKIEASATMDIKGAMVNIN